MKKLFVVISFLFILPVFVSAQAEKPMLFRQPTMNKTDIVFTFAGDLWKVSRTGGAAQRLTSGVGTESKPRFSPDGNLIALTGEYNGNVDVYVNPASGGEPRRLNYHPSS